MRHYDIAVIGGGLVGASFARAMQSSGCNIAIIERQAPTALYAPALDNRGLALSWTSRTILQDLQVWNQLQAHAFRIDKVHISEQASFGFTQLTAKDYNLPSLGYVVSASILAKALLQDLNSLANTDLFCPDQIQSFSYLESASHWQVSLAKQNITAKLLVVADGTESQIRNALKISVQRKQYDQTAMVCNIKLAIDAQNIAYERFTKMGVLALLPFGSKCLKCVLSVNNDQLAQLLALSDEQYLIMLQNLIGMRVGRLHSVESRITFPIQHVQALQVYTQGAVLIGNTANTLHPVAAQGFNLGLRDVMTLAKILHTAKNNNLAINQLSVLQEYAARRSKDHQSSQDLNNSLVQIFANDLTMVKNLRRFGLAAIDFIPALRRKIIQYGVGVCR